MVVLGVRFEGTIHSEKSVDALRSCDWVCAEIVGEHHKHLFRREQINIPSDLVGVETGASRGALVGCG